MACVRVTMLEGRSIEQKRALAQAINHAMVEHAGANPELLHVIIDEVARENWGRAGVLMSDLA
ncbi:MAG: 2-hydroxymuconate tautomerase [Candidatus Nanopelagicales bacterium]